jgi:hypothetical protein
VDFERDSDGKNLIMKKPKLGAKVYDFQEKHKKTPPRRG